MTILSHASGLSDTWRRQGLPGGLLAKTGTLAESDATGRGDGLFMKSLLFAVDDAPAAREEALAEWLDALSK